MKCHLIGFNTSLICGSRRYRYLPQTNQYSFRTTVKKYLEILHRVYFKMLFFQESPEITTKHGQDNCT